MRSKTPTKKLNPKTLIAIATVLIIALIATANFTIFNKPVSNIGSSNASSTEPADINNDNKVDVFDLSILLSKWGTNNTTSDLNKDGTTNVFDLSMLLSKWGVVSTVNTFDVKTYGAVGDDSADDTSKIQATINAAAAVKGTVIVSTGTYKITSQLNVPAGITISGTGEIHQISPNTRGLNITGSDVTVEGITLRGRHSTPTYSGGEYGIYVSGPSNTQRLQRININNITVHSWGYDGITLRYVDNFYVNNNTLYDIGYSGIVTLSCSWGEVNNNTIDNITPGTVANMYGIALTYSGGPTAENPTSTDITVDGNRISRVDWECIDSHGGSRLTVTNNTLLTCRTGVMIGASGGFTPKDIIISGNTIDNQAESNPYGNNGSSILLWGQDPNNLSTGRITNNTILRSNQIYLKNTKDIDISENSLTEMNALGIFFESYNQNFKVTNNIFTDIWSNTRWTAAIHTGFGDGNTPGYIAGNTLIDSGTKTATYFNQYGYYYRNGIAGITVGNNDFASATRAPVAGEP